MNLIIHWWNSLPISVEKKDEWIEHRIHLLRKKFGALHPIAWPFNRMHSKSDAFLESDWIYKIGDDCHLYVTWCFKWHTKPCKVIKRHIEEIILENGQPHYVTFYQVLLNNGDKLFCQQSDLCY